MEFILKNKKSSKRIFIFSCPRATESVREVYLARYPNGRATIS